MITNKLNYAFMIIFSLLLFRWIFASYEKAMFRFLQSQIVKWSSIKKRGGWIFFLGGGEGEEEVGVWRQWTGSRRQTRVRRWWGCLERRDRREMGGANGQAWDLECLGGEGDCDISGEIAIWGRRRGVGLLKGGERVGLTGARGRVGEVEGVA